jgi:hypothetical protein
MKTCAFLLLGTALALGGGCSNDSGTSGPQVMTVELDVTVYQPGPHPVIGATVQVQNMTAVTDTLGLAIIKSDINTLVPNNTYTITVIAAIFKQTSPLGDTIRIQSSPNEPSGYLYPITVSMEPK